MSGHGHDHSHGVSADADRGKLAIARRREVARMLHDRFHLDHVTLQMDHAQTKLLQVAP